MGNGSALRHGIGIFKYEGILKVYWLPRVHCFEEINFYNFRLKSNFKQADLQYK